MSIDGGGDTHLEQMTSEFGPWESEESTSTTILNEIHAVVLELNEMIVAASGRLTTVEQVVMKAKLKAMRVRVMAAERVLEAVHEGE